MNPHLRYFYAVVRCCSFTEAAQETYISQSAISQHIQALERELGVTLIDRAGRKLALTAAGEYFYRHSQIVQADYERLCAETRRIAEREKSILAIGYMRSCDGLEVHHTVSEFCRRHPDIEITAYESTPERLSELLEMGKIDIALSQQHTVDPEKYITYPIVTVNCYVELSANDPLSGRSGVEIDDLKFLPGILVASGNQREVELSRCRDQRGFPNNFLFADTLREARMLVVSGKGFMPIDGLGSMEELKPSICRVPLCAGGVPVVQPYCAFWKITNDKPCIKEFVDILRMQFPKNRAE